MPSPGRRNTPERGAPLVLQAARSQCDLDEELAMAVLEQARSDRQGVCGTPDFPQDLHHEERRRQHEAQLRAEEGSYLLYFSVTTVI